MRDLYYFYMQWQRFVVPEEMYTVSYMHIQEIIINKIHAVLVGYFIITLLLLYSLL